LLTKNGTGKNRVIPALFTKVHFNLFKKGKKVRRLVVTAYKSIHVDMHCAARLSITSSHLKGVIYSMPLKEQES
jgi:hypothetical protein